MTADEPDDLVVDDVIVDDVAAADELPPLADGVSEERATGWVAVLDTRELRYVTGPARNADALQLPRGARISRTGRYQLRRV